jgi:tetratricopeptide (TPR) repeat protein
VDTQTRHALKQDPLVNATGAGVDWMQANRTNLIKIAIAVVVVAAVIVAGCVVYNSRSAKASVAFGKAMDVYTAPIRTAGQPSMPGETSFTSAAERAKTANPLFTQIASDYSWSDVGSNAEYFAGLTYLDMGQDAQAESTLQKAASSHDSSLAALAKMALAGLYRQTNRTGQAVDLYQQIIKKPAQTVPASAAKLQLAQLYENTNPDQAKKLYAEIKDEDKTGVAGQIATQKLSGAKAPAGGLGR